jgi:kynurenine formamidase
MGSPDLIALAGAIAAGDIEVVDLTHTLTPEFPTIVMPPELGQCAPFRMEEVSRYDERGPAWYWNNISMGEHTGTHFDAPVHWISGKDLPNASVDTIPPGNFIASAAVIDISAQSAANPDYLHGFGTETIGTDAGQAFHFNPPYPAHYYMHGKGRYGLQCLANLDLLPPTGSVILAAPLKIRRGSGSPLRVLALVPRGERVA